MIKLFEDYNEDYNNYYKRCNEREFFDLLYTRLVDIDNKVYSYLKSYFYMDTTLYAGNHLYLRGITKDFKRGEEPIYIFQIEDEYFLVEIPQGRESFIYYKCDQYDGLIELLKNRGIIR